MSAGDETDQPAVSRPESGQDAPQRGTLQYDAFISYSRGNAEVADKLERDLEAFPLPKDIRKRLGRRHLNVFRDVSDLTGNRLESSLEQKLEQSRTLVVLCSPAARGSRYVGLEIDRFVQLRGAEHIVPAMVAGGPNNDVTVDAADWAFPNALTEALGSEPLATDLRQAWKVKGRKAKLARGSPWVQLVADIVGATTDELTDRIAKAERRRLQVTVGILAIVLTIVSVLSVVAVIQRREAQTQRQQAIVQRNEAVGLAASAASREVSDDNAALAVALAAESSMASTAPLWQATSALVHARIAFSRQAAQQVREPLVGHDGMVGAVKFKPDGSTLASADSEGVIRFWDPSSGAPLGDNITVDGESIGALAFSPDGRLLAATGAEGVVRLWDTSTHQLFRGPLGSPQPLSPERTFDGAVTFSPDGKLVASAGADGVVRMWDPSTGKMVGRPLTGHTSEVSSLVFSPDGRVLASGGGDDTIRLWDPTTGAALGDPIDAGRVWVSALAFSPDGARLASANADGAVRLWDPATRLPVGEVLDGHGGEVSGVAFSPDGRLLATVSADRALRMWDPASGRLIGIPLAGHTNSATTVAFSPDGTRLATGGADRTVRLWDPLARRPVSDLLGRHGDGALFVAFCPDGDLLTAGSDGSVQRWEVRDRTAIGDPLPAGLPVAISPDGSMLAVGTGTRASGAIQLWDLATGRSEANLSGTGSEHLYALAFSPDGRRLASAEDDVVRLWDPVARQPVGEALAGHDGIVYSIAFSPDGSVLASAGGDGTIRLWDSTTGKPIGDPIDAMTYWVRAVVFSPDGTKLASAGADGTVRLWDPATRGPIGETLQHEFVTSLAFNPDGSRLASGGEDVRLWDVSTQQLIGDPMTEHSDADSINDFPPSIVVAFSPDGAQLVSADTRGEVRLWGSVWDAHKACALATPYLTRAQLQPFMPSDWTPKCQYAS